jgi:hypothetical protein
MLGRLHGVSSQKTRRRFPEVETSNRDSLDVPSQPLPDTVVSNKECGDTEVGKQLTVRSLVVQILSQCRCWTPSSAVTTMSKVQYSMYPVCVLGRHCTLFASLFVLDRHYFLFAWPCVLVRPASCFPGFMADFHPVCLVLYSWQTVADVVCRQLTLCNGFVF